MIPASYPDDLKDQKLPADVEAHVSQARRQTAQQVQRLEQQYGKVFRFVRRYMQEHHVDMRHQQDSVFTATRCAACQRAVVFFDTSRFIPQAAQHPTLLHLTFDQRNPSKPQYVNRCPYCGRWHGRRMIEKIHQQNREEDAQRCVIFSGQHYLLWLKIQSQ